MPVFLVAGCAGCCAGGAFWVFGIALKGSNELMEIAVGVARRDLPLFSCSCTLHTLRGTAAVGGARTALALPRRFLLHASVAFQSMSSLLLALPVAAVAVVAAGGAAGWDPSAGLIEETTVVPAVAASNQSYRRRLHRPPARRFVCIYMSRFRLDGKIKPLFLSLVSQQDAASALQCVHVHSGHRERRGARQILGHIPSPFPSNPLLWRYLSSFAFFRKDHLQCHPQDGLYIHHQLHFSRWHSLACFTHSRRVSAPPCSSANVDVPPPSESTAHYYASPNHSFSSRNSTVSSRNTEIFTPTESSSATLSHTSCQLFFSLFHSSSPVFSFFLVSRLFHFQAQCTFPSSEVLSGVLPEHYHWFAAALERAQPSVT
jgi:hypothetical protein